jgi:hypothetical protein
MQWLSLERPSTINNGRLNCRTRVLALTPDSSGHGRRQVQQLFPFLPFFDPEISPKKRENLIKSAACTGLAVHSQTLIDR